MATKFIERGPIGQLSLADNAGNVAPYIVDEADDLVKYRDRTNSVNRTVVNLDQAQTLTNKTLTAPIVPTLLDSASTVRVIANSTAKTIADGAATTLFSVAVAAGAMVGGMGSFLVRASDGTDQQTIAGIFTYSAEAKLTVVVGAITYVTGNEAKSVSAGTLTLAFTADVSVANVVTYKLQPTGSLTETTPYTVEYTLFPTRGVVTIL